MNANGTTAGSVHPFPSSDAFASLEYAIHVWTLPAISDQTVLASFSGILSSDERERAGRFHFVDHQAAFIANRGRLRWLLSRYLSCSPAELVFHYGSQGKPSLLSPNARGLEFNLSHTDGMAIIAVSRGRQVGIDIEKLVPFPDALEIARQQFCKAEFEALNAVSAGDRLYAFYRCWTAKEAFLKGLGDGLERPLDSFQISPPVSPLRLDACEWDQNQCRIWQFRSLAIGNEYLSTLAFQGIIPVSDDMIQVRKFPNDYL
jgi:4'-phosphopantetheinyl transferase